MRRGLSLFVAAVCVALTAPAAPRAAAVDYPVFHEIGPLPLASVTAPGSALGHGPDGQPWLYLVSSGSPAVLSVVDARTGEREHEFPLPGASGSWAVASAPNGDVYVGSYSEGRLYRWTPGADAVEDLGQQIPGETFIWSLDIDEDGRVYGGTGQFDAHAFRFDPATGDTTDLGALGAGQENLLARSIAVGGGTVYVGTGAHPRLVEIDADTGDRREVPLPEPARELDYVYDLDLRGDLLFVRASPDGSPRPLHVYDVVAGEWIDTVPGAHGLTVSPVAPDERSVYFTKDGALHRYDLSTRTWSSTGVTGVGDVRGFGFLELGQDGRPGASLVGLDHQGRYFVYSPGTGAVEHRVADAVAAPAPIRSITEGPDGLLYAGSFLAGGLAGYDPETGEKRGFAPEVGQAEGMTTHDGALWIGTYPGGDIYRYDPDRPAEPGANPRHMLSLYDLHGQSRPFALSSAGRYLAIGTVARNGGAGGGLTLLDPDTGEHWFTDVVPGHSVVSLAFRDGVLYGGTSVYGGAGGPRPTDPDAVVFAYDVERREKLWQVAPVPGEGALGELAFDNDGKLWSHTPVTVFRLDPGTRRVEAVRNYGEYPWDEVDHAWVGSRLWIDPYDGLPHVVTQRSMYKIDPTTLDRARWFRPVSYGFLHNNGNIYLARDPRVWEYTPSARPAASVSIPGDPAPPCGERPVELAGFGPGELVEVWLRPSATYLGSVHAGPDGTLSHPFTLPGDAPPGENRVEIKRVLTGRALTADFTVPAPSARTEHDTVVFGEADSRVPNGAQDDGCTFLDEVWLEAPFAGHGDFVRTVHGLAAAWRADGLFTARESRAVTVTAARSDVGR
ncbi:hypothetical protein [Actinophytocola gossypii]|uniref:PQQ-binding-like beta-propeller repeat protein n=1 Tax=Actinophytocola gossypii TaxID=2812003 RepID=A0ABT2J5F2_9PSEU|nr:hypothetical protein [Actinophytocola gossypii]MCT2583093.1 hypothetical protein [Actinophytocola gossypii]